MAGARFNGSQGKHGGSRLLLFCDRQEARREAHLRVPTWKRSIGEAPGEAHVLPQGSPVHTKMVPKILYYISLEIELLQI